VQNLSIDEKSLPLFYKEIYWPLISGEDPNSKSKNSYKTKLKNKKSKSFILPHLLKTKKRKIKIFEIGAGDGNIIFKLDDELKQNNINTQLYACDFSEKAINTLKKRNINAVVGDAEDLFKFGKADVLILSHVLEHYSDLNKALFDIKNLLKEDGLVYVELPGILDLKNKKDYLYSYQNYNNLGHIHNFSLTTLKNIMAKNSLRLLEGNEYIKAIFEYGECDKSKSDYKKVLQSLHEAKKREEKHYRKYMLINYVKRVIKTILLKRGYF